MKTIAIIGANGQVGTEVCLFLRQYPDVEVVPICRNEVGSQFLRRCGFEVRHGSIGDPAIAPALLDGCDLVADFSLPTGSSSEVRQAMEQVILNAIAGAPAGASFVYLSSVTAFGMPDFRAPLKHYRLSRNQYGASKRYAESLVARESRKAEKPAYVLRVGVVHGEIQAVSRKVKQAVRSSPGATAYVPDAPSFTVFAFSTAEALVMIARGREQPGTYTLVSNPAWSWVDLHRHYQAEVGTDGTVVLLGPDGPADRSLARLALAPVNRLAAKQKDVVGSYLAARLPRLESRLRARYHAHKAAGEIERGLVGSQYRPYGNNHTVFPGERLQSLSDSRITMPPAAREVRALIASASAESWAEAPQAGTTP